MNFLLQYLREHSRTILTLMFFFAIYAVSFLLYHLPLAAVMYPTVICLLFGLVSACLSIYKAYQKHYRLTELQKLSDVVIQSELKQYTTMDDQDYRRIISHLCSEKQEMEQQMTTAYSEMIDYYTIWVHQIKTPISSMRLHLKKEDTTLSRKLTSDLLHIEQYVEMVLTYLRMGSDTTDYVFREVELDKLLKDNIRKLRGDFIIKKLNLQYTPSDETIITDEKWLSFVIGQILSNALKYTKEGSVSINIEPSKMLCITDTGIGIAPEDIPRIFERGFTGYHGREHTHSSGLGLYLCKEICNRLGIDIDVISEIDKGTTVRLNLNQKLFS